MKNQLKATARGFTLIELLISVTIVAILTNAGAPAYNDYIAKKRVQKSERSLASALNLTRSEAVKRNARVYLVPSDAANWESGWAITSSSTKTYAQCLSNATDCVIVQQALDQVNVTGGPASVVYTGAGRLVTGTSASFGLCALGTHSYKELRTVAVSASGRPRITSTAEGC